MTEEKLNCPCTKGKYCPLHDTACLSPLSKESFIPAKSMKKILKEYNKS